MCASCAFLKRFRFVAPGSRCPRCETPIHWYDNVPVFGWLWLRGKCRNCGLAISPMYPLVELATGLLFVACYLEFGLTQTAVKWLFFTCLLIVLTITDLRVRLLPDLVNWPGFAAGLLFSAAVPPNDGTAAYLCAACCIECHDGRSWGCWTGFSERRSAAFFVGRRGNVQTNSRPRRHGHGRTSK